MTAAEMPVMSHYYPEMGETAPPAAVVYARLSYNAKHYHIRVHPSVPTLRGVGIVFEQTETVNSLRAGSKFVGWNKYTVTRRAMAKISRLYTTTTEALL